MKQYLPYKPCSLHALIYCDMYTHTERMLLNKSCTVHTLIYCDIYIHNQRMLLYKSCTLHTLIHTMKGRLYTISSKLRYYSPVRYLHFFKRRINWKSYLNSSWYVLQCVVPHPRHCTGKRFHQSLPLEQFTFWVILLLIF